MLEFTKESTGPVFIAVTINDGRGYAAIDRQGRVNIQGEIGLSDLVRLTSEFLRYVPLSGEDSQEYIPMFAPI